jgi:hypothetical protein
MPRIAILLTVALLVPGPIAVAASRSTEKTEAPAPVRTGKERLSDKASDEQRANDCKVPLARRTRPRPSDCQDP